MANEVLSVATLNRRAREILQQNFPLLWVAGEVSNLTRAASGHVYFSLKDEAAQVRCVMFRNRAQLVTWRLENGQQVEAQALVTLYEARGDFQLNVEGLRRAGLGKLYEAFARLRERLEGEGLFSAERKRDLPRFPHRVGIVTSPQAAALHDILIALRRRAPHLPVVLYPSPVQGDAAGERLAAAIASAGARAAEDGIDVLIVTRGGGSIEDLWAFNEEVVARAIAACPLPVVSGIGHETDVCIADFVADHRAATPTAAAELVSAGWFDAADEIAALRASLHRSLRVQLEARMQRIDLLAHRLVHPGQRLARDRQAIAHLATRLDAALARQLRQSVSQVERWRLRLAQARPTLPAVASRVEISGQRLHAAARSSIAAQRARLATFAAALAPLNPQATLERGYSIVRDDQGAVVRSRRQLAAGDAIDVRFADGHVAAHVDAVAKD